MRFGLRLRQERQHRALSQEALAEALGVSPRSIRRWEQGLALPHAPTRLQISRLFGFSLEELAEKVDEQAPSALLWHVPYSRNPFFTGREEILQWLHELLNREHTMALTQALAVTGLGGIGKTQIALEYAYRYRQNYRFVFWTGAATRETLLTDLAVIADLLQLPERENQNKVPLALKQWFATHRDWLWILDNADDVGIVYDMMPVERPGHLLLTSRAQAWGSLAQRMDVETMGMAEGALFLLRRAKLLASDAFLDQIAEDHLATAEAIALEMDFLPLALDQAGAYIEEVGCGLSAYLELYQARRKELLRRRGHLPTDHPEPVATTWSLSFQKVEQANPAAADLLQLCAFLEPDAIPEELISEGGAHLGPFLGPAAKDALRLNDAIEELRRFSLLQRNPETRTMRVHRLVQAVLKDAMEEGAQHQWAERAVRATNRVFPDEVAIATWPHCRRCLPQAQACSGLIQDYALAFEEAASLLSRTAIYLQVHALYEQVELLEQRAVHILEHVLGPDHPGLAPSLNNLGLLYYEQGKYEQAEPLFQRALCSLEHVLGPNHPDLAFSLKNLAFLYHTQEQYEQAESLCQRVVRIRQQSLGPDHPDTASSLNNLAIIYHEQGKYAQTESLFQQAVRIKEHVLGPDHPGLALALNNLAIIYYEQGKYEQAEPLSRRALHILEHALAPDYTIIAHPLNALANTYRAQGKYEQAESLFLRALSLREQSRPQHSDTAETLHDFAVFREAQGHSQQAASLYQRALAIREQVFGPQHRRTNETRHRLRTLLQAMSEADEAVLREARQPDQA